MERVYYCRGEIFFLPNNFTSPLFNDALLSFDRINNITQIEQARDGVIFCSRPFPGQVSRPSQVLPPIPVAPTALATPTGPAAPIERCPGGPTRRSDYEIDDQNVCRLRCFVLRQPGSQPQLAFRRTKNIFTCCEGFKPFREGIASFFSFINTNRLKCVKEE